MNQDAPLKELAELGVKAFTDDGLGVASSELMKEAFSLLQDLGLPLLQHAEFPGHGGILAPSEVQQRLGVRAYEADPEWRLVERDLNLLKSFPRARYHVLHVSSAKTLELIKRAKSKGLSVTAEVSPHHLFFTDDDIEVGNSAFKMNPPIRSRGDRDCLRKSLQEGTLDFIATDHAPHELSSKSEDFNQASFLGVESQFGWIKPGRNLHAVLVNVNEPESLVTKDTFVGKSKNSCFLGSSLPGRVHSVFQPELIWYT